MAVSSWLQPLVTVLCGWVRIAVSVCVCVCVCVVTEGRVNESGRVTVGSQRPNQTG